MRNAHQDLKYGEKNENHGKWEIHTSGREMWRGKQNCGKFRNVHCRTRNMARKLKIMENEKHPRDVLKNDNIPEYMKYEKCTLQDLEYGEKTENHGK